MAYKIYLILLCLCCVSIFWNRRHYRDYWPYWFAIVFIALLAEVIKPLVSEESANVTNHLYQPLEFSLMVLLYSRVLKSSFLRDYRFLIIGLYWLATLGMTTFIEGWHETNRLSFYLGSLMVIILVMGYFYQTYVRPMQGGPLLQNPFFWINTAHLFFYSGTYFYFALHEIAGANSPLQERLFVINALLNYMLYILYIAGTLCRRRAT